MTPGAAPLPGQAHDTLVSILERRAYEQPDALAYRFLVTGEVDGPHQTRTFGELWARARAIGAFLQSAEPTGERALLLYEPGVDFLDGFFGAELGGLIPVPAYPPDPTRLDRSLPRLRSIVADCSPRLVLTTRRMLDLAEAVFSLSPELGELRWVATDELPSSLGEGYQPRAPGPADIAFLQYTSGSTGDAKGVMVTHRNICSNLAIIAGGVGLGAAMKAVSWLPPYHDLGLIGALLQPLHVGGSCVFLSPLDFLSRPSRWLRAISHFQANLSGGPNFAFDLCVRKVSESEKQGLDLSLWQVAMNGAEPTRPETLERFHQAFAPHGFRPSAHAPGYGLAEATLTVTGTPSGGGPQVRSFDPEAMRRGLAVPGDGGLRLVSSGSVWGGQRVLIVDPDRRRPLPDGEVGEVWIAGPSVAPGYWQKPEVNEQIFGARLEGDGDGPFLRTGDLGFLLGGQLFVSGRRKDVLIFRGLKHHPHDIEQTAQRAHPSLRPGCSAAFSFDRRGVESLGLVAEIDPRQLSAPEAVVAALRQAIAGAHDLSLSAVWLLSPGALPKTSSGKLQRYAAREGAAKGTLSALHHWQAPEASESESESEGENEAAPDASGPGEPGGPASLRSFLIGWVAAELKAPRSTVDPAAPLTQYGLDSVAATQLMHALERRLGRKLDASLAWKHPSIDELSSHLSLAPGDDAALVRLEVEPAPEAAEYPLSIFERELFELIERQPCHEVYTLFVPLRAARQLEPRSLERAFERLIDRQDNLRTSFHASPGGPVRRVHERAPFTLAVDDLRSLSPAEQSEATARACRETRGLRFDLAAPPLLAARLLLLSERESLVLLLVDHLVADAWGMGLIHRELTALYEAEIAAAEPSLPSLPPLALRARDYAVASEAFFRHAIPHGSNPWGNYPAADFRLPLDRPRPERLSPRVARHRIVLDGGLRGRLEASGREHGFSLSLACLVAFEAALHRLTRRDEVLFAVVFDNRRVEAMRGVVAHMIYREMFHGDARGGASYLGLLASARRFALEDRPLEQPRTILTEPPARRVVFNFHHYEAAAQAASPLFVPAPELLAFPYLWDIVDLSLQIFPTAQGVICSTIYRSELYDEATVERLSTEFVKSLDELAADPTQPLVLPR